MDDGGEDLRGPAGLAPPQGTVAQHAEHGRAASVALGRPDGERQGAAGPGAGAADDRPAGQRPAPGQGDGEPGEVDAGASGVAGLDSARVALDELRLPVNVEVVEGQPAVPAQIRANPGSVLAGGRVIDAEPCCRGPAGAGADGNTGVRGYQPAVLEQGLDLAVLASSGGLGHDRAAGLRQLADCLALLLCGVHPAHRPPGRPVRRLHPVRIRHLRRPLVTAPPPRLGNAKLVAQCRELHLARNPVKRLNRRDRDRRIGRQQMPPRREQPGLLVSGQHGLVLAGRTQPRHQRQIAKRIGARRRGRDQPAAPAAEPSDRQPACSKHISPDTARTKHRQRLPRGKARALRQQHDHGPRLTS